MNQLRPVWLLIIAVGAAVAGYAASVLMAAAGYGSPALPMASVVTLTIIGLLILTLGILVWWDLKRITDVAEKRRRGDDVRRPGRRVHPLQAVRVVAAGQACGYAGVLISGWHGGVILDLAPAAGMGTPNVTSSLVMMIGGLLWVIIGFVVESLCRLPPEDGGTPGRGLPGEDEDGTEAHAAF